MRMLCFLLSMIAGVAQAQIPSARMFDLLSAASAPKGSGTKNFVRVNGYRHAYPATSVSTTNTLGNALVVFTSGNWNGKAAVWDSLSNTWASSIIVTNNYTNSAYGTQIGCFIALNCKAGSNLVQCAQTGDEGITIVEYSGVTAVDTLSALATTNNATLYLTNSSSDMMLIGWAAEIAPSSQPTASMSPGSVAGTTIEYDSGHYDAYWEWLNGAAGYPAATYTFTLAKVNNCNAWIAVGLR